MGNGPASGGGFLRSETGVRLISSLVLVAAALGTAIVGGPLLALFWLLVAGAAAIEWTDVCKIEHRVPMRAALLASALAGSVLVLIAPGPAVALGVAAIAILAVAASGRRGRDRVFGLAGLAVVACLAIVPPLVRETPALGLVGLFWIFAVVWGTDIAAYFTGRAIGGPKLAPKISPGKTWSGFFGGLVFGTLAATFVALVGVAFGYVRPLGWPALVALAASASVVGQVGDLAESKIKRVFAVKDSSKLIPGHGGVLDRIDAFVAVCAFVALMLVWAASV